jgi:type I restriction enzyme R subunit
MRAMNVLQSYTDFDWQDLELMNKNNEDYKAKYLTSTKKVNRIMKTKRHLLDDIDFEPELIHTKSTRCTSRNYSPNKRRKNQLKTAAQKSFIIDFIRRSRHSAEAKEI